MGLGIFVTRVLCCCFCVVVFISLRSFVGAGFPVGNIIKRLSLHCDYYLFDIISLLLYALLSFSLLWWFGRV